MHQIKYTDAEVFIRLILSDGVVRTLDIKYTDAEGFIRLILGDGVVWKLDKVY